jgi:signal transduction histidine kinase
MDLKLTQKIVFVIVTLCIVFSFLLFLLFRLILYDNLREQKAKFVQRLIGTAISVLENETRRILTFTEDWAAWDTMYEYISHPTPGLERNLSIPLTLRDAEINLLIAVRQDKKIARLEGYSHLSHQSLQFALLEQKKGATWKFLTQTFDAEGSVKGIVLSDYGPLIAVSSPILHSDNTGPRNGRLLMGRLIDHTFAERIGQVIYEKTRFITAQSQERNGPTDQVGPLVRQENNTTVIYYPINDIWNRKAFTIRVEISKHTFGILEKALRLFFLAMMIGILFLGAILYFIMNRLVVRRVKRISATTSHIITLDDLSQRIAIPESYNDEIVQLSKNINQMLKRLQTENISKEEVEHMAMLNEKLIFLGRVTANVIHEINNPLFAIENSIRIIKKHLPLNLEDKRLIEVVQVVEQEIKRVKTISRNIHKFAIPPMEKAQLSDITTIMDAAIKVIKWSHQLKKTGLDYLKAAEAFPVYCNPEALQQVFINIILNAIEAMQGKGKLTIDVSEKGNPVVYRIDFIDTGPGFRDTIKAALFEPFKSTKKGKGFGLGLNISDSIIKNHGGTITLDENYRNGTHLIVNIPKGGPSNDGKTNTTDHR